MFLAGSSKVPGLSGGNVNRNLSLVNSLRPEAFQRLLDLDGWTPELLHAEYLHLTGEAISEEEGNRNKYI